MRPTVLTLTLLFSLLMSGCAIGLGLPVTGVYFNVHANPRTLSPMEAAWMQETRTRLTAMGFKVEPYRSETDIGLRASKRYPSASPKDFRMLREMARQAQQTFYATLHTKDKSADEFRLSIKLSDPLREPGKPDSLQCTVNLSTAPAATP